MSERSRPTVVRLVAAFLAVYVIWGSTYLAIRLAIESMPPFLMAGVRFLVAGAMLVGWTRARGAEKPTWLQWRNAAVVGALLLMGGNGAVVWSEQRVPTGVVSLLVATVPLWMVLLGWVWKRGVRPDWRIWSGLALGLVGIAALVGPDALGAGRVDRVGAMVVLMGSLAWATGSIFSRSADLPPSPFLATGMQMLAGGTVLTLVGVATGEPGRFNPSAVTTTSLAALGYLVFAGSFLGFTAYIWLLKATTPARVATYAYVNPVVAVFLGWAFLAEPITVRTCVSALVVLAAVVLITLRPATSSPPDVSKPAPNRPTSRSAGVGSRRTSESRA